MRAISAPRILNAFCECAQSRWVSHREIRHFSVEFDEGGGLKNRYRLRKKKLDLVSADFTYT
jgi:hypothetical protein